MTERITHDLIQGSDEWAQFRLTKFGASEAAAMLGISTKAKRTELLHMKHTGNPKEFSDWVQKNILDYGHEVEALSRPIIEELIGQDLYPVTRSLGVLSASCDGLTLDDEIAFEHKQWNTALAESVHNKVLPDEYQPQCQQIMLVAGAQKVIFVCSDGTRENMEYMEVYPDRSWFDRIIAGWAQFEKDLASYVPEIIEAKPVGHTPETLPALHIELTGVVKHSNLRDFKAHALAVFAGINRELTTDQHFADAEKTVKWCEDVESRLKAAKEHALSQTQSIDELFRAIDDISAEARRVRLDLDKLVTKRKTEVKDSIIAGGRKKFADHCAALIADLGLGDVRLEVGAPDFVSAAKNKRTLESLHDAIDTALANGKIAADAAARDLRAKLDWYKQHAEYAFLFRDLQTLIQKAAEDFQLAVTTRIEHHKQAEAEKAKASPIPAPAVIAPAPIAAKQVQVAPWVATTPAGAPTLRLGQINERLAPIALSAEGLATLGFKHAATDKAAKLYHEEVFPQICAALIRHIEAAAHGLAHAA
ncbi:putative phage-related endonuclease [Paraburkholderia sp. WC7.3g]|uniref:YqaJ viral recombinase family protein n=1 Tax=Paraburkholderia sp. WC7.3g TaxID=2991070 RepID=UPI003D221548